MPNEDGIIDHDDNFLNEYYLSWINHVYTVKVGFKVYESANSDRPWKQAESLPQEFTPEQWDIKTL